MIEEWCSTFREKNAFPHPRVLDASFKPQSAMLPPVLHYNVDLKRKFVRFCTQNVTDLNTNIAREYVSNILLPTAFELHESLPNWTYSKKQTVRYLKREHLMHPWYRIE
jgi:hypothetical protein